MTWTRTKKTMFKDGLSKQWGGLPHSLLFGHIADEFPATKGLQLSTRTFPLPRCHRQHTSSKRTTLQTPANASLNLHPQFPGNSRPSALEEFFSTSTPGLIPYKKDHTTERVALNLADHVPLKLRSCMTITSLFGSVVAV